VVYYVFGWGLAFTIMGAITALIFCSLA